MPLLLMMRSAEQSRKSVFASSQRQWAENGAMGKAIRNLQLAYHWSFVSQRYSSKDQQEHFRDRNTTLA
jgi:hypothetical protein